MDGGKVHVRGQTRQRVDFVANARKASAGESCAGEERRTGLCELGGGHGSHSYDTHLHE